MMNKEAWERERLIRRQASSWYWKLKDPLCERDHEEWQRWQAVPEHQAAFEKVSSDWERWRRMPWPGRSAEPASRAPEIKTAPARRPQRSSHGAQAAAVPVACAAAEEAAYWYIACADDPQLSLADRQSFLAWMRRSPENIAELFKVAQLDGKLRRMKLTLREFEVRDSNVIGLAASGPPDALHRPFSELDGEAGRPRDTKKKKKKFAFSFLAAAAGVLMGIGIAFLVWDDTNNRVIVTDVGEWEHRVLEDGTTLHIDARTRLKVDFTTVQRIVHMYEGSAMFDVAKDPERPFIVKTRLIDAIAVGTRFGVSVERGVTTTVSEGLVRITRRGYPNGVGITLKAGEKLFVTADSLARPSLGHVQAERKLDWVTGWLTFEGETIGEAVEQFNRHNSVQIEIGLPEMADARIFGRFRADSPAKFASMLARAWGLAVIEDSSGKVVRIQLEERQEQQR